MGAEDIAMGAAPAQPLAAGQPSDSAGALRRGLKVLRALDDAGEEGFKAADIADMTELPRPTVYRLIKVLIEEGAVKAVGDGKHYVPRRVAASGLPNLFNDALVKRYAERLKRIAALTGNSVFLVRRDADDSLCLHREFGDYPMQVVSTTVGGRHPLGVGAAGLALLSAHPVEEIEQIAERLAPRLRSFAGMSVSALLQLALNARARGYAVVGNYAVKGVLGVGLPICDRQGRLKGAISVSSTVERMSLKHQLAIAKLIQREIKASQ